MTRPTESPSCASGVSRSLAHDLRAPLGPLALALSAIQEDARAPEEVRELAVIAEAQCNRMRRLIDALAMSPDSPPPIAPRSVAPRTLIEGACSQIACLGGSCQVRGSLPATMTADPAALIDAIVGLMECVAGEGGHVLMETTASNGALVIRLGGPTLHRCIDALSSRRNRSWRDALARGARGLLRAHGGEVNGGSSCLIVRIPLGEH